MCVYFYKKRLFKLTKNLIIFLQLLELKKVNYINQKINYMNKNYAVSVDYLIAKFTSNSDVIFKDKFYQLEGDLDLSRLSSKEHNTVEFDYCYSILFNGSEIGKFYTVPSIKGFETDDRVCQIKFENHIFYSPEFEKVLNQLKESKILQLKQKNFSRLDISFDSEIDIRKKLRLIYRSIDDNLNEYKPAGGLSFSPTIYKGERSFQFGINHFIVVYNKTKELKKSSSKNYISKFHMNSGLKKDVIRFEVRLLNKDKKIKKYLNLVDVWKLHSEEYLLSIVKRISNDYFYFNKLEDKNISRCPKEYILELPDSTIPIEILKKVKTRNININKLKENLNFLLKQNWSFPNAGSRQQFDYVKKKAENEGLNDWLEKNMYGFSTFPFSLDEEEFYEKYK